MAVINRHISIITLNINDANSAIKRHRLTDWTGKQAPILLPPERNLATKDRLCERMKEDLPSK